MKKLIFIVGMVASLSGCAAILTARKEAVKALCANRDSIAALAIVNNDTATLKALDAYCPINTPAPVPTETATGV